MFVVNHFLVINQNKDKFTITIYYLSNVYN